MQKIENYGGGNPMPVTAVAAASASLKDAQLVPERKRINAEIREETFQWLDRNGYSYIPSVSNCFMLDTKRPAKEVIAAMAQQECPHWTHLAGDAHLYAHHRWNARRDEPVPGGVSEGDEGDSSGKDVAKEEPLSTYRWICFAGVRSQLLSR